MRQILILLLLLIIRCSNPKPTKEQAAADNTKQSNQVLITDNQQRQVTLRDIVLNGKYHAMDTKLKDFLEVFVENRRKMTMLLVRKATFHDSETIATYLFLAMEDIVYKFIGEEHPEKAREFLVHFVTKDNNQYSYQNCWVAEDNRKVVAAINLYNGAHLNELRQPVIEHVRSKFNKNFDPEDETQAGEYYIDTLGVDADHQSKGIGTKLLQFVIDEYVNRQHQTLGLLVDEINPNAKRLYLKLGFKSAGRKVLFGKNMGHLQMKG